MGRLRYAQKFLLIGVVLIAPLGFVVKSYLDVQSRDRAFAAKERVGVVYLRPLTRLLDRVVAGRAVAVQVAAGKADPSTLDDARSQIASAISAVDAAHSAGSTLQLTDKWASLKQSLQSVAAERPANPQKALADYNGLITGIEGLIAGDGNNSNMILDPDNDAYYVMDATLNRVTALIDQAGQAGDLQTVIASGGKTTLTKRLALEDLKSAIATTLSNSDPDYASAIANTKYAAMKGLLSGPLAAFDNSLKPVAANLSTAVQTGALDGAAAGRLGATARGRAMALDGATLPVIDHLLKARIAGFDSNSKRTEGIALLAVLVALYLFVGFYLS